VGFDLRPGKSATSRRALLPRTGLFKPVDVSVPLHLGPPATDGYDPGTRWWRHERRHRRVLRDPAALLPLLAEREAIEARWLARPPDSRDAFAEADRLLAAWAEAAFRQPAPDRRPWGFALLAG
jgi:hypothetical protein